MQVCLDRELVWFVMIVLMLLQTNEDVRHNAGEKTRIRNQIWFFHFGI